MWIWLAMLDLKAHVFRGHEFHVWSGSVQVLLVVAITLLTAEQLLPQRGVRVRDLEPGAPKIRPAFTLARRHLGVVLGVGVGVGVALGLSAIVVPRWGLFWFGLALGIVVGVMMLTYVTVPARVVGIKIDGPSPRQDGGDRIGGTLGASSALHPISLDALGSCCSDRRAVCSLGAVLLALGFTLQAGATGAVKAIKMSAKLAAGNLLSPQAGTQTAAGGP